MTKKRKILIVRILLFIGTAISLYFVPWQWLFASLRPTQETVQAQVEQALDIGLDNIIVYVDQGGKEPSFYAAGWHNPKEKIPAYPEAYFKIASVAKLYDAVSIAKLVNDGKLSLEGTLAEYFPELVDRVQYANEITLKMMVGHTSGIPNYTDVPGYWSNPTDGYQATLELVLDKPGDFKPGTDYYYSNTNYLLINELIERVSGTTGFGFIKERILQPLALTHTFGSTAEVNTDSIMSGHHVGYEPDIKFAEQGIVATLEDVGTFLRALNDGSVFEPGEQEIYSSIYHYEHTGLVPGYQTIARYHPDIDAVVIQCSGPTYFLGINWNLGELIYNRVVKILREQSE